MTLIDLTPWSTAGVPRTTLRPSHEAAKSSTSRTIAPRRGVAVREDHHGEMEMADGARPSIQGKK